MNGNVCYESDVQPRWNYNLYRFVLWTWLMNEITVSAAPVDLAHTAFYMHLLLYTCVAVFIGIPLVYSEVCIAQYTNCDVVSTWNFCPILRGVGYGTYYLILLKTIYLLVITSWYLKYTFYAALDPPPWFSCDEFNDQKCMVKRVNVTVFQRCIEAQTLFNEDCGMKTASNLFFQREIGSNTTKYNNNIWKSMLATLLTSVVIAVILIKKEKLLKIAVRLLAGYLFVVLLILCCVALSSNGAWSTHIGMNWKDIDYKNYFYIATQAALSCGIGSGVIGFLSRDVDFRSPATMTAVGVPLFSIFISLMLALILFNGIKTMSFYHGEEHEILEIDDNIYFYAFASVTEALGYFDDLSIWAFAWFSTVFLCLLMNTTIVGLFLMDMVTANLKCTQKHKKISCMVVLSIACTLSGPFHYCDLSIVLADVTEIIQLTSSFFFSVGIYWIYGFHKHNVDIIFMIGVKASFFWKIAWITSPVWILTLVYLRWINLLVEKSHNSIYIVSLSLNLNTLLVYLFMAVYFIFIVFGIFKQLKYDYTNDRLRHILTPLGSWGPRDEVLFRSRNMFVPEIMTREFLYRQVRIHCYSRRKNANKKKYNNDTKEQEFSPENTNWSVLTSN